MSDQTHNPSNDAFSNFVNTNLDMDGVDGVCFETVAFAMRDVIKNLPIERDGNMWGSELDRLQQTLRMCLSIETIGRLIQDNPRFASVNPEDIDLIVNLSITLAFICYNELSERFGFENPQTVEARTETARLWVALRSTMGWVNKAAKDGDPVAERMAGDITRLLEEIRPMGWSNNTKSLPGNA